MQKLTRVSPLWLVKNIPSLLRGFQISCLVFSLCAGDAFLVIFYSSRDLALSEVPNVLVGSTLCQQITGGSVMSRCGGQWPPDNLSLLLRLFSTLGEPNDMCKAEAPPCLPRGVQSSWHIALYSYLLQNVSQTEMLSALVHSISSFKLETGSNNILLNHSNTI